MLAKQQYFEKLKVYEINHWQITNNKPEQFLGAREVAKAIFDMTEIEGINERKRQELVERSDFNLNDAFKMFGGLSGGKHGINCDDLYQTITCNLRLTISKDELFILFYALDKDCDGLISFEEFSNLFTPHHQHLARVLHSREPFHSSDVSMMNYFNGPTRQFLQKFLKGFVDCEVSIELVR